MVRKASAYVCCIDDVEAILVSDQIVTISDDRRFSDHRPGFGSTARQGEFAPRIFREFSVFFGILLDISLFSGILRGFSARAAPVAGTQGPGHGHRTARHLKAPPGRAVRFSVYE